MRRAGGHRGRTHRRLSALRRKALICGNGGSAAELTSRLTNDFIRPGIAAIALTTDTSFLTAYANDFGYAAEHDREGRSGRARADDDHVGRVAPGIIDR